MGTRFLASEESMAQDEYKQMVVESSMEDIYYSPAFSGVHANYLLPSIKQAGLDVRDLPQKGKLQNPDIKAWRDIWSAGHGVGAVKNIQSLEEIYQQLKTEYTHGKNRI